MLLFCGSVHCVAWKPWMAKKNVSKAEAKRRAVQSQMDKRGSSSAPKTITTARKPAKKNGSSKGGGSDYASLVLDPCNAQFCQSNMPGNSGAQQVRLPFRQILRTPTTTTGLQGETVTGGLNACNTITGILTPHAMMGVGGPAVLAYRAAMTETMNQTTTGINNGPYYAYGDPVGLNSLNSLAGEMRPIAACIRITCLGNDSNNQGLFFGYEGAAKQFIAHAETGFTTAFAPRGTPQDVIFNGMTTGDTYKTYEVRINYPNASPVWQDWRSVVDNAVTATGTVESGDANDISFSEMPIAIVGVTSAQPGVNYLFDGAIVYEWQPKTIIGLVGPRKTLADPTALAKVARAVQAVANKWGGMLISTAADYATGGSASAIFGLLRQGYAASTSQRQPVLRLGN